MKTTRDLERQRKGGNEEMKDHTIMMMMMMMIEHTKIGVAEGKIRDMTNGMRRIVDNDIITVMS